MSEFTPKDFSEPIRMMSDAALLRLEAIANDGELDSMRAGDTYFSNITKRHDSGGFQETHFDTISRAFTIDAVADALVQQDMPAPHLNNVLSGMILALTDAHDLSRGSHLTPLDFDLEHTAKITANKWLLSTIERSQYQDIRLYSLDMGHVAITSVLFTYDEHTGAWRLGYEMRRPQVTFRSYPDIDTDDDFEVEFAS